MALHLIVKEPFGSYAKGDRITEDVDVVRAAYPAHVLAVAAPDEPPPAPAPTKAAAPAQPPPAATDKPADA